MLGSSQVDALCLGQSEVWRRARLEPYTDGAAGTVTPSGGGAAISATGASMQYGKIGLQSSFALAAGDRLEITYDDLAGTGPGLTGWALSFVIGASTGREDLDNILTPTSAPVTKSYTLTGSGRLRIVLTWQSEQVSGVTPASVVIAGVKVGGKTIPIKL